jgi:DNA-directed RNA polymerase subunit RPC12/RpoP
MAGKKSSGSNPGGIPLAIVIPLAHAAFDVATNASCPDCGSQVVVYICTSCKKPVWPNRGQASA